MKKVTLREDFIKLGQALKAAGLVDSGAEAKEVILDGQVKVNGETDMRREKNFMQGTWSHITGRKSRLKNKQVRL